MLAALAVLALAPRASGATAPVSAAAAAAAKGYWSFVSSPALHPAALTITRRSPSLAPGYVFIAPVRNHSLHGPFVGQRGPLILDSAGNPVWAHPLPGRTDAMNFRVQSYRGQPVLTWWQGRVAPSGVGIGGHDVIVDRAYRTVAIAHAGDGYTTDLHDFVLTSRGTALLIGDRVVRMNLTRFGGARNGQVLDNALEEVDVRTGRILWRWSALAHIGLAECPTGPSRQGPWDAFHVNSIDEGPTGKLLISARNTSTVYQVDRRSNAIDWRLGGSRTTFALARGVRFFYQHDARYGPGGTVTLFDNGALPRVEPQSRGVVVALDTQRRTASLARAYIHRGPLVAGSQGNLELLPGGDAFIGWGAAPYVSEIATSGELVFEAHLHGQDQSYRAFRFSWDGLPQHPPAIAVTRSRGTATVYASWNGATDVAAWRVLAGASPASLTTAANAWRTGFETPIAAAGGPYFAVQAVDATGRVLGTSAVVRG